MRALLVAATAAGVATGAQVPARSRFAPRFGALGKALPSRPAVGAEGAPLQDGGLCLVSDEELGFVYDVSGRTSSYVGDYHRCVDSPPGWNWYTLWYELGADNYLPTGVCIPQRCAATDLLCSSLGCLNGVDGLANSTNPAIAQAIPGTVPLVVADANPYSNWDAAAIVTAAVMCAWAAALVAGTALAAAGRPKAWLASVFDMRAGLSAALATKGSDRSGALASMNGVRVLSMVLVILGHSLYFLTMTAGVTNFVTFLARLQTWAFQVIPSAEFAVDTFFVLSGFLAALLMTKQFAKVWGVGEPTKGDDGLGAPLLGGEGAAAAAPRRARGSCRGCRRLPALWCTALLHRYLRIVPIVLAVTMTLAYLFPLFGSGPLWWSAVPTVAQPCRDNAWTNLLFVNNFKDGSVQCAGWMWYLANDFQMFIFVPLVVAVYLWSSRAAKALLTAAFAACVTAAAVFVTDNQLSVFATAVNPALANSDQNLYMNGYYMKPWMRAPPFIAGVYAALLWYEGAGQKLAAWAKAKPLLAAGLTGAVIAGLFTVFYVPVDAYQRASGAHPWGVTAVYAYTAGSRPIWGVLIAAMLYLCFLGVATPQLTAALSWSGWEPLARLTLGAYLTHPAIMYYLYLSLPMQVSWNGVQVAMFFTSIYVFSYVASALAFVTIEYPVGKLEKKLFTALGLLPRPAVGGAASAAGSSTAAGGAAAGEASTASSVSINGGYSAELPRTASPAGGMRA